VGLSGFFLDASWVLDLRKDIVDMSIKLKDFIGFLLIQHITVRLPWCFHIEFIGFVDRHQKTYKIEHIDITR